MNRRDGADYGTIADRIAHARGGRPSAPAPDRAGPEGLKHCWVTDDQGRMPALLLQWRRTASGWQGRVVRPVADGDGWILVDEWLPAARLESA